MAVSKVAEIRKIQSGFKPEVEKKIEKKASWCTAPGIKDHFDTHISCVACFLTASSGPQNLGSDYNISAYTDRVGVILPPLYSVFDAHSDGIFRFFSKNFAQNTFSAIYQSHIENSHSKL